MNDEAAANSLPDLGGDWFTGHEQLGNWTADAVFSPWGNGHGGLFGTPERDVDNWIKQTTDFTCAVVAQQMILKDFGIDASEAELVYHATANGWLHYGGTSADDLGRLLEHYGIDCHRGYAVDIECLLAELAQGRKVIVAVDSGELWKQDWFFEDWFQPNGADHAVVVTGLDMRDPNHPMVLLNDPGHPDGAGASYPLAEFLNAWADSGYMYMATTNPPPNLATDPILGANFHADTGMYMDIAFWTAFLATMLHLASAAAEHFAINEALWHTSAPGVSDIDAWTRLDDAARNQLFYAI